MRITEFLTKIPAYVKIAAGLIIFLILVGIVSSTVIYLAPSMIHQPPDDTSHFPERRGEGRVLVRSPSDEEAVRNIIFESQTFESLTMYVSPDEFAETALPEYWLSENRGGEEIKKVKKSLKRLQDKGFRYGDESKAERFEFKSIRIYSPRDYAEVSTVERWFLPMYRKDGSRVEGRNEFLGPYIVDYALCKIDNKWLIQEASTPRYEDKK